MRGRAQIWNLAFCGVLGGFCTLLLLAGNLIPFGTYAVPCAAGLILIAAREECAPRDCWALYLAVSFLALILVADRELALFFVLLTGYYPLIQPKICAIRLPLLRLAAKLAIYGVAITAIYSLLILIFPVEALLAELGELGRGGVLLLVLSGAAVFLLYDVALRRMTVFYRLRLHPKLHRPSSQPPDSRP